MEVDLLEVLHGKVISSGIVRFSDVCYACVVTSLYSLDIKGVYHVHNFYGFTKAFEQLLHYHSKNK